MNTIEDVNEKEVGTERSMGIFQIRNKVNQKIYVGCSDNLDAAWDSHKTRLDAGVHPNGGLQSDYHKMGPDNFEFELIEHFFEKNSHIQDANNALDELEKSVLEKLQPYDEKGYNKIHG